MSSANKKVTISELCDDLLCEIFDRLSVGEVLSIQTVNKDFHRSAQQWLKTVDNLFVEDDGFFLHKAQQKPTVFRVGEQALFSSLDKMLTICNGIKEISFDLPLTASKEIEIISRCENIKQISLEMHFTDEEWTNLLQLIKYCDVQLTVYVPASETEIKHLDQLINSVKRVKSLCLIELDKSMLKLAELLDETVEVKVIIYEPVDDNEIRDLIFRRVDDLTIHSHQFQSLDVGCYLKLSKLEITHFIDKPIPAIAGPIDFPRLKFLDFCDFSDKGHFILSFFSAVNRMDQLDKLWLVSPLYKEKQLKKVLKKTPNLSQLSMRLQSFSANKIPAFRKLFFSLSYHSSIRLPSNIDVKVCVLKLTANDVFPMSKSLTQFASVKRKTKLNFAFYCDAAERKKIQKNIKALPKNLSLKPMLAED